MEFIKKIREKNKQTQRGLAEVSGVAFGTIQLVEKGENVRLKTFGKIAEGLGYQVHELKEHVDFFFREAPASVFHVAKQMSGNKDWKIHFFNFVDSLRSTQDIHLIQSAPYQEDLPQNLRALLAATVETICDEKKMKHPLWCGEINSLDVPWFLSGIENLKAMALVESPLHFRKRNIFVMENFLSRA